MPIQIGQRADHGFDEPLGLLSDCHRRIEHFLRVLSTIAADAAGGPLTPEYRRALEGALRYFAEAAIRHTADEEVSLFPRLRTAGSAAAHAMASLDRLERDHDEADGRHAEVDRLARQWLEHDGLARAESEALRAHLLRLEALYADHIAVEDTEVFPAAAKVLDRAQLEEIGREMAARRQLVPKTTGRG